MIKNPNYMPLNYLGLLTVSPLMVEFMTRVEKVAKTNASILVRGDSGTGKELVARYIHHCSTRREESFSAINCAALSSELMASELFGHKKGAFTGAIADRKGLLEQTHNGTLFFDEIAEMPLDIQARLLRVTQDHLYTPVGSSQLLESNIRLVSATHKSLRSLVKDGGFREDLMYRVRVIPLFLPKLTERGEDLPMLIWHFIEQLNAKSERQVKSIAKDAWQAMLNYSWPGNVRELANMIEYAHAVGSNECLTYDDLNPDLYPEHDSSLPAVKSAINKDASLDDIQNLMLQYSGNKSQVADALGISRTTLWRRLNRAT